MTCLGRLTVLSHVIAGVIVYTTDLGTTARAQVEHSVQLFMLPRAIEPAYAPHHAIDTAVFFAGEPVEIQLQLRNRTGRAVRLHDGPDGWPSLLQFTLRAADNPKQEVSPVVQEVQRSTAPAGSGTLLLSAQADEAVFSIASTTLPHGRYRILATLPTSILPAEVVPWDGRTLSADHMIDLRQVVTRHDTLNFSHHMAIRSRWAREYAQARAWLEKLFEISPASIVGHAEAAALWKAQGDCGRAAESYRRALAAVANNLDSDHPSFANDARRNRTSEALRSGMAECKGQ